VRRGRGIWAAVALLYLLATSPVLPVQPDEVLKDPVLEQRARGISAELRCLVCQNQSIDDSDAPLARDLRILVRERVRSGDSDADVRDFLVRRYGEFVLLKPSFGVHTALLWLGPALVLLVAGLGMFAALRRRRLTQPAPLSADEQQALGALLDRERPGS
jgi:cytochrome c-type biogenesis protein CcmH